MIVNIPTEVIPIWYIEKWNRENCTPGSPLDYFLKRMINEWRLEQVQNKAEKKGDDCDG